MHGVHASVADWGRANCLASESSAGIHKSCLQVIAVAVAISLWVCVGNGDSWWMILKEISFSDLIWLNIVHLK